MVDLGRQEDWSDYMLIEWAAALELHQRGRVKAVLPLLVGETDFWSEAHAAFGGIQALPTSTSGATMEKVVAHLGQTTGDDSLSKLRELLQQVGGNAEPTVQGLVACILKFQGVGELSQVGGDIISIRTPLASNPNQVPVGRMPVESWHLLPISQHHDPTD